MALPPVFIEFLGSYTGLKVAADGVKRELGEIDAEGSTSLEGLGAVSSGVLLGIGAAAVGAAYEGVKLAMSFQQAMTQISTQAGVPKAKLAGLSNDILNLAGQVGFSPDSLAEALYHVESSFSSIGITSTQAMSMVKIAAQGAAVGGANLVDVQNALDAAVASGIPGVQNMSQAMGALNAIVGSGDMQMQDLTDAMSTGLLAVMKGFGLSLTDVGAALATFGDNNIRGQNAATALRMAVMAMQTPAATAGKDLKAMGLSTSTLATVMQKGGLLPALELLNSRMNKAGLNGKQMSQTLTELYGKKAGTGLDVLISQLGRVQSKYPEIQGAAKNFGSAVDQQNSTLAQHMNDAKAALDSLGIRIGDALLPPLTRFMGELSKGLAYLSSHTGAFWALAAGLGALTTALVIAKLATIDWDAVLEASPVMLIATAIIALGAGVFYAYKHFKSFRDAVKDVAHALEDAGKWIDKNVIHNKELDDIVKTVGRDIEHAFKAAWKEAGKAIKAFENGPLKDIEKAINKFKSFWKQYGNEIMTDAKAVWGIMSAIIRFYVKYIVDNIKLYLKLLKDTWKFAWDFVKDYVKYSWDMVKDGIKFAIDFIGGIVKVFLDVLHGHWKKAWDDAKHMFGNMWSDIKKTFSDFTKDAGKLLSDAGKNIIKGLADAITGSFGLITKTMGNLGSMVSKGFKSAMKIFSPSRVMYEHGGYVVAGLVNALVDGQQAVRSAAGRMGGSIMQGMNALPPISLGRLQANAPTLGTAGAAAGNVIQYAVQLTVQGHVLTDQDLRDLIQQELLRLDGRNTGAYLSAKI